MPLRAFFKWLSKENHILSNPASELELPRVRRRLPAHILSPEEIEQVMAVAMIQGGEKALRDRGILETLYSTGLRRTELGSSNKSTFSDAAGKRTGRWAFEGLTSLLPIYDELEDGAEVLWRDHSGRTLKRVRSLVKKKSELEAFDDAGGHD